MSKAVAILDHVRGETIVFGLRAIDPVYDGTETVSCDVKEVATGMKVPPENARVVLSAVPSFLPGTPEQKPAWTFTISAEQSADLEPGSYITDARIVYGNGTVDYPKPLGIRICERVTA